MNRERARENTTLPQHRRIQLSPAVAFKQMKTRNSPLLHIIVNIHLYIPHSTPSFALRKLKSSFNFTVNTLKSFFEIYGETKTKARRSHWRCVSPTFVRRSIKMNTQNRIERKSTSYHLRDKLFDSMRVRALFVCIFEHECVCTTVRSNAWSNWKCKCGAQKS